MNQFIVVFTCKGVLTVFKETVEARDSQEAVELVKQLINQAGLRLNHVTSVVQL